VASEKRNHSCLQLYRGIEALTEVSLERFRQLLDVVKLELEEQPTNFDPLIAAAHEYAVRHVKTLADQVGLKLEPEEDGKVRWLHITLPVGFLSDDYFIIAEVDFIFDKSNTEIIIDFDFIERTTLR
jgi:hypothetical protein